MTRPLCFLVIAAGLSGCFLTYDPETVTVPAGAGSGLSLGTACVAEGQCASGHCTDGVCCESSCGGQCEACDATGAEGNCVAVSGVPHGARAACTDDGSGCGGTCDGTQTSSCDYPTTLCRPQACADATQSYAAFCDGGTCPTSATLACDPFVCGGNGCKTGCGWDADCTAGNYCSGTSCVPKKTAGSVCSAANQCATGFCSPDGRCCDGACTGSCESCNGVNTGGAPAGTCAPIAAGSRPDPTHTGCTGDASGALCAGACDGTLTTACVYPTAECRAASCSAGTQTNAASCSAGSCPAITTAPCAPYACGATACLDACSTSADCAAGRYCDGTNQCVPKLANGSPCTGAGTTDQCVSGQCAQGVCCATACTTECKACNLPGTFGTCANVPAGQDPNGDCAATDCQTTCSGSGSCTAAPSGEYCASNTCVNQAPDPFGRPTDARANVAWCNGSTQSCPSPSHPNTSCAGHTCDGAQCNLTCLDNSDCVSNTVCVAGECRTCVSGADCYPGAPLCDAGPAGAVCTCPGDPTCGDSQCGSPQDCVNAGFGSVCLLSWDVCQCTTGDACNGRAPRCGGAPGFCTCGAGIGNLCLVGQLCSSNAVSGTCKIAPGFPCTANPADCASGTCGAGGLCAKLPAGRPCAHASDCVNGSCGTTWTCN